MTVQDFINWFGNSPNLVLGYFAIIIAFSLIGLLFVKPANFKPPINYLYGILIYAVTIPGLLALVLLLYSFFFLKTNLLQLDLVTYFVPLISLIITLVIINKTIPMSQIPGFGKLSGLFIIVIITFIITYILQRMFFGVFFVGRFQYLIVFFLALLFGLKIAWDRIVK
ncbi:hypothetical protein D1818_18355 [Aquimarina sp. BL5]|uniref:hypothetical protein n=1 Tax=Aquimarina sp. BL5 TaxID=1714860 RepID=UPI000E53FAFF|nr:hypothetical protein [Aquimarina sp. BL5]AXT52690.1 hypothetical protein D1818_18355 [Aquimarina sp. BL5]RKN08275.1 hypothetical protein D7036_05965 [Aquimarina sp. BL5]